MYGMFFPLENSILFPGPLLTGKLTWKPALGTSHCSPWDCSYMPITVAILCHCNHHLPNRLGGPQGRGIMFSALCQKHAVHGLAHNMCPLSTCSMSGLIVHFLNDHTSIPTDLNQNDLGCWLGLKCIFLGSIPNLLKGNFYGKKLQCAF